MPGILEGLKFFIVPVDVPNPIEFKKTTQLIDKERGKRVDHEERDAIYILHNFQSPYFERLRNSNASIYHPDYIRDCARLSKRPKVGPGVIIRNTVMEGVTISCTGIRDDRERLHELVQWMGGRFQGDLTDDITHVIALETNTTKYRSARNYGIPVVLPTWIKDSWDQATRLPDSQYSVYHTYVSVHTVDKRAEIQRLTLMHGGMYSEDLTKKCTHLITEDPKGKKYHGAVDWGIPVVHTKWFFDCLEKQARLEEELYVLVTGPGDPAKNNNLYESEDVSKITGSTVNSSDLDASPMMVDVSNSVIWRVYLLGFERKVEQQLASMVTTMGGNVLPQFSTQVDVLVTDSITEDVTKLVSQHSPQIVTSKWIKDSFQNKQFTDLQNYTLNPYSYSNTLPWSPYAESGVFGKTKIQASGLNEKETLVIRKLVTEHGGVFFDEGGKAPSFINYIVAGHGKKPKSMNESQIPIVSKEWIYRCVEEGKILDIGSSILFTPMPCPVPYESFKTSIISLTGFREEERDHIDKLVKLLGGDTTDKLTRKNTHLICKEPTGAKYDTVVNKWKCKGCKPVSVEWLYESAKQGHMVPEDEFILLEKPSAELMRPPPLPEFDDNDDDHQIPASAPPRRPPTQQILEGVNIIVHSSYPVSEATKYHNIVASLGGNYQFLMSQAVTHILYEGKTADLQKEREYKNLITAHTKIVHPMWLEQCAESGKWLPESDFLPATNNKSLTIVRTSTSVNMNSPKMVPVVSPVKKKTSTPKRKDDDKSWQQAIKKHEEKYEKVTTPKKTTNADSPSKKLRTYNDEFLAKMNKPPLHVPCTQEPVATPAIPATPASEPPRPTADIPSSIPASNDVIIQETSNDVDNFEVPASFMPPEPVVLEAPVVEKQEETSSNSTQETTEVNISAFFSLLERTSSMKKPTMAPILQQNNMKQPLLKRITKHTLEEEEPPKKLKLAKSFDETSSSVEISIPTEKDEDKENIMEEDEEDSQIANSQVAVYVNPLEQSGRQKILDKLRHPTDDNNSHHEQLQQFARVIQGNEPTSQSVKKTTTPKKETAPVKIVPISSKRKSPPPPVKAELARSSSSNSTPFQYHFVLSNFQEGHTKKKYEKIVKKLRGFLDDDINSKTTHVITPSISGSAKCLGACAGGKWLLIPEYLDESEKVDFLVDEDEYEWSEAVVERHLKGKTRKPQDVENFRKIASAAKPCRLEVKNRPKQLGLFEGWKCAYLLAPGSVSAWSTIMTVGGGKMGLDLSSQWSDSDLEGCNYAIVENKLFRQIMNSNNQLMNPLVRRRVCVVEVNALKEYIYSAGKDELQSILMPK